MSIELKALLIFYAAGTLGFVVGLVLAAVMNKAGDAP